MPTDTVSKVMLSVDNEPEQSIFGAIADAYYDRLGGHKTYEQVIATNLPSDEDLYALIHHLSKLIHRSKTPVTVIVRNIVNAPAVTRPLEAEEVFV